jgi:hypothetical protein
MGRMMVHVVVAHEHDVPAYFDPSAAVKRKLSSFPSDDIQQRRSNQS